MCQIFSHLSSDFASLISFALRFQLERNSSAVISSFMGRNQGWDTVKKFKNLFKFKRNLKEFK
jgi:hypothetical protein